MATFNKETGMYEARKLMAYDNTLLIGQGETKEEAIKDLKEGKKIYKAIKLEPIKRKNRITDLEMITHARPDLAEYINEQLGNKKDENT